LRVAADLWGDDDYDQDESDRWKESLKRAFKKFVIGLLFWTWHICRDYQTHLHGNTSKYVQAKIDLSS